MQPNGALVRAKPASYPPCKPHRKISVMELCYFVSVKYTILKWSSTLNSCWVCLCVACVCGSESALRCPFSRAALLWELSVFCRQKDSELFLYFLLGHFIFFMRVSILLPGIDQHWHAAQVKGYSWAGLDKRDYAGIPLDPFMEERETPEGCFPNLSAFLSNTTILQNRNCSSFMPEPLVFCGCRCVSGRTWERGRDLERRWIKGRTR